MNILLILNDAFRPDHIGCFGYPKPTTPIIDSLAAEGVVFRNVISTASHTLPPIVSMVMSEWASTHGIVSPSRYAQWIEDTNWKTRETPLKILQSRGYRIEGELVRRWAPLGFEIDTPGDEITAFLEDPPSHPWFFMAEPYPTHLPYNPPEKYYRKFLDPGIQEPSAESRKRLEVVKNFLIVHPSGVLSKLEAGEEETLPDDESDESHKRSAGEVDLLPEDLPHINALYDGEVKVFDDLVGTWTEALRENDQLNNTLIIITSDHGEELMERGHVGHSSCNLMGTLYDESIKVPLIMRCPGKIPAGAVIDRQISHVDLMPTVFELLEIQPPSFMEGSSLLPLLGCHGSPPTTEKPVFRPHAFSETTPAGWQALKNDDRQMWSIRSEKWKIILTASKKYTIETYEVYNLIDDPGETRDLYHPDLTGFTLKDYGEIKELMQKLQAYVKKAENFRF